MKDENSDLQKKIINNVLPLFSEPRPSKSTNKLIEEGIDFDINPKFEADFLGRLWLKFPSSKQIDIQALMNNIASKLESYKGYIVQDEIDRCLLGWFGPTSPVPLSNREYTDFLARFGKPRKNNLNMGLYIDKDIIAYQSFANIFNGNFIWFQLAIVATFLSIPFSFLSIMYKYSLVVVESDALLWTILWSIITIPTIPLLCKKHKYSKYFLFGFSVPSMKDIFLNSFGFSFLCSLLFFPLYYCVNGILDRSEPKYFVSSVSVEGDEKDPIYYIERPPGYENTWERVYVNEYDFGVIVGRKEVSIEIKEGALNIPWISKISATND